MDFGKKNIMLLGAGFTTKNMGVWALASGTIKSIFHTFPVAQVSLLDYHHKSEVYQVKHQSGSAQVRLFNLRFSKKLWLRNNVVRLILIALMIRIIPSLSLREKFFMRNVWFRKIMTADMICSIAGGDSFSDIYGFTRLIYVVLPQILVLLLDRPLVLLPQTIGPFRGKISKRIAQYIIAKAKVVYSRDYESLIVAREILRKDRNGLKFCYDMGFVLEPCIRDEQMPYWLNKHYKDRPLVGLNVSGLLYMGGYTRNNMFGLKSDYRQLMQDLIEYFIRSHNARVMLVPHVLGYGTNLESDETACRHIMHELGDDLRNHILFINEQYNHHEIKAFIGRCDFFIGSRMHACIAALSQCIPSLGLAYSRKFHGVFESIGMGGMVIDLRQYEEASLMNLVDHQYFRRKDVRDQLKMKIPEVQSSVMDLFAHINVEF